MKIGEKISVPRETLVDFVLDAIAEINHQNFETHYIIDAFKCCGLNPWSQQKSFEASSTGRGCSRMYNNEVSFYLTVI
jgi:hypothetical protein